MRAGEWQLTVKLIDALWPQVAMTDDVAREWYRHLERFDAEQVQAALRGLANDPKFLRYPGLGVVVEKCKAVSRRDTAALPAQTGWPGTGGPGFEHFQKMRRKFLLTDSDEG